MALRGRNNASPVVFLEFVVISAHNDSSRRTRRLALALVMAMVAVAIGFASVAGAGKATLLGKTKRTPSPNCPSTVQYPCEVMGQVTGFQRSTGQEKGLFKVPKTGRLVAWSVDLARPSEDERAVFEEFGGTDHWGTGPTAGISVLNKTGKSKYKLRAKSPILKVRSYMGQKPTFTLETPLRAREGDVVAITTATWLPNFSSKGLGTRNVWVASRKADECGAPDAQTFFEQSSPHTKVGSERRYGCVYDSARLLYWAYLVPRG